MNRQRKIEEALAALEQAKRAADGAQANLSMMHYRPDDVELLTRAAKEAAILRAAAGTLQDALEELHRSGHDL